MKVRDLTILLSLGALVFIVGCQQDLIGKEVPQSKRIKLVKSGPQTGRLEAFDYSMNYKYLYTQPNGGTMGAMEFSASLEKSSGGLDSLTIWVYLLDGSGRILETKNIYDSGYKARRMERSFSVTLETPPETAGISFAHTAQASMGRK